MLVIQNLKTLFEKEKFDSVIHLASFPRQKVVNADPTAGSKVMSEGLLNLLELSRQTKVKTFLLILVHLWSMETLQIT